MLDIWMLAAMLLPFAEIITLVLRKEISCRATNGRMGGVSFLKIQMEISTFSCSH